ncbi:unnamed protein product [Prunus armeniaca]
MQNHKHSWSFEGGNGYGCIKEEEKIPLQQESSNLVAGWRRKRWPKWPVCFCKGETAHTQGKRERGSSVFKIQLQKNFGCATALPLTITSSLKLRFGPTTCLRTRERELYATVLVIFLKSF